MKRIAFIVHGKISRHNKLVAQIGNIFEKDYQTDFHITEYPGHFEQLAEQTINNGASHVICVGGDGSLNETVNGVMNVTNRISGVANDKKNIRVGLLPHGTGNDFARTMGVKYDPHQLKNLIDGDSIKEIDLGLAKFKTSENKDGSRYFINITDIGMGGVIAQQLSNSSKLLGPTLTYQSIIVRTLFTYTNQPVSVKADNFDYQGKIMSFIVANGKYFGAGLGIAPDASPNDGMFSTIILGEITIWDYLSNLGRIRKCLKIDHPQVKYYSASEIMIESLSEPAPIDMDGEFIGYAPMSIKLISNALCFLWPC